MYNLDRADYVVIKDFEHVMVLPLSKVPVKYKKGDGLNLRVNGNMAKKFIGNGYIKRIE
jgi:hypothetical protein